MALPIIAEGEVLFEDQRMPSARGPTPQANLEPITLAAKEGLALTNGTAVMCAIGVLERTRRTG